MIKISKIKNVQSTGTWESKHDGATMYKYEYEFEDGGYVQASHKSQMPFHIGDEVEYEVTHPEKKYGKVKKAQGTWSGSYNKKSKDSTKSFALSYAKDLCIADKIELDQVLYWSAKFNDWLNDRL